MRDPTGHSYHVEPIPLAAEPSLGSDIFLWGLDLFNHGYYWEAHEAWEGLWQVADRDGPLRMLFKGLILLSAAGVKIRERKHVAAARHARRAAALLRRLMKVPDRAFERALGMSPATLAAPSCARICGHGLLFLKHGVGQALRQCQSGQDHTLVQVSNIDDYRQQKALQPARSPVERLLADARQRLIETGTRNRLVHTPRGGKRTRSLPIVDVDADGLFATLVRSNRMMRFLPGDRTREPALEEPNSNVMRYPAPNAVPTVLKTTLDEEKLEKRLLAIYRDAKTAEEEQGINILFLAIGFLRWYEDDKSEVLREAPLVLVPVSLTRDLRRSTFDLRCRDDDLTTNQAIQERLRADFGVVLPELPESEEWVPTEYFATVTETIATKSRWSIDPTGVELGFYSFSKLLMIRDLEPAAWGEKSIVEHSLLRGLAEGFNEEPSPFPHNAPLDKLFAPSDLIQVVNADSSQTIVIETIRKGRNLVVQGPPGTGKSQTITNIIAAAVHDGKSVLFVAEKMAALNVVHGRLQKVGLGPICLQLHSRGANKRLVLAEIEETLGHHAAAPDATAECARLKELRDTLNAVDERMHASVGDTGMTPFQALSRLVAASEAGVVSDPNLLSEAAAWSKSQHASVMQAANQLSEITASAGPCFASSLLRHSGRHAAAGRTRASD